MHILFLAWVSMHGSCLFPAQTLTKLEINTFKADKKSGYYKKAGTNDH